MSNSVNSVNRVNSVNSYSAVLPPSPMVFFLCPWPCPPPTPLMLVVNCALYALHLFSVQSLTIKTMQWWSGSDMSSYVRRVEVNPSMRLVAKKKISLVSSGWPDGIWELYLTSSWGGPNEIWVWSKRGSPPYLLPSVRGLGGVLQVLVVWSGIGWGVWLGWSQLKARHERQPWALACWQPLSLPGQDGHLASDWDIDHLSSLTLGSLVLFVS